MRIWNEYHRVIIILLLAGVLPSLLAEDDVLMESAPRDHQQDDDPSSAGSAGAAAADESTDSSDPDENGVLYGNQETAAEALHDDALTSIPALRLDLITNTNTNTAVDIIDVVDVDADIMIPRHVTATATNTNTATDKITNHSLTMKGNSQQTNNHDDKKSTNSQNTASEEGDSTLNNQANYRGPNNKNRDGDDHQDQDRHEETPDEIYHEKNPVSKEPDDDPTTTNTPDTESPPAQSSTSASTTTDSLQPVPADTTAPVAPVPTEPTAPKQQQQEQQEQQILSVVDDDDDGPIERLEVDYASRSAGALILEKSPSFQGTSNLLNGDKDKYAIAPCEDKKKFVVIGLSEDILVKQIRLANYERYSSHVKHFQILGSQTMGNWVDLGTYTASSKHYGEQSFDLNEPSWARYLKFRFLSHFGDEHYCTVSQIKVHGSTMLQGFHEQWTEDNHKQDEGEDQNHEGTESGTTPNGAATENEGATTETPPTSSPPSATAAKSTDEEKHKESGSTVALGENDATSQESVQTLAETNSVSGDAHAVESDGAKTKNHEATASQDTSSTGAAIAATATATATTATIAADESEVIRGRAEPAKDSPTDNHQEMLDTRTPEEIIAATAIPDVIARASYFDLPAHKSSTASVHHSTEALDTKAIATHTDDDDSGDDGDGNGGDTSEGEEGKDFTTSVKDAVKAVVAEASGAIKTVKEASTMSHAVKELHQRLVESIGVITMEGIKIDMAANIKSDDYEGDHEDNDDDDGNDDGTEEEGGEEAETEMRNEKNMQGRNSVKNIEENEITTETISGEAREPTATSEQQDQVAREEVVRAKQPSSSTDGPASTEQSQAEHIVRSFPSSRCLDELDFGDFKSKIVASRSNPSSSGGNTGSPTGKMEPIFKTLTDEIRSLKLNQNVQDQFNQALIACYQSIVVEMASHLNDLRMNQELRLQRLETIMTAQHHWTMRDYIKMLIGALEDACRACASLARTCYGSACVFLENNSLHSLLLKLLATENGPFLLALTSGAGMYVIVCHFVLFFLYPFTRSRRKTTQEEVVDATVATAAAVKEEK